MTSLGNNRETAVAVVLGAAVAGSATLLSLYLSKVGRIQWCIKRRMPHSVMLLCLHRVLILFLSFLHSIEKNQGSPSGYTPMFVWKSGSGDFPTRRQLQVYRNTVPTVLLYGLCQLLP